MPVKVALSLTLILWIGSSSPLVQAQAFNAAAISGQVSTPFGQVAVNAQVRVCAISAAGFPCTPTSQVFADDNLTILLPNPISTDQYGNYKAFVKAGLYLVQVSLGPSLQPTYTYYVSAGAGGALSSAPPYSIQFASTLAGQFSSDPLITIDPVNNIVTSPEFYSPGSGTGIIEIAGGTSGSAVSLTVDPNTQAWTFTLPTQSPLVNGACLTATTAGVSTWASGCGNPSSAPVNSVQIASSTAGSFNSDSATTINPVTHLFSSPDINNAYVVGSGSGTYASISAAVTAAGTTGSVRIPANYPGTDTWTNPHNVRISDGRPYNPGNVTVYAGGLTPLTTIKARDYGALCNGSNDDTAAINTAVQALATVGGGQITPSNPPTTNGTVELPQGTCVVRAPIQLPGYGSLVGSSSGTWVLASDTFVCNTFGCDIVQLMIPYPFTPQITTTINRRVSNINFVYLATTTAITGVHVFNATGNTSATPYPSGAAPALYQLPGVIIADNSFFAMDTGVKVDDCGECMIDRNQFRFLHLGLWENGNNFSFEAHENSFENGTGADTPTTGASIGFFATGRNGYFCSNTNLGCSGGSVTVTELFPQGCTLASNTMAGWDNDVNIPNCQGIGLTGNGFDYGSDGAEPSSVNSTILLGQGVLISQIVNNFIANNQCAGYGIEIGAPTSGTGGETYNDFLIQGNYFSNYCTGTPSASGIFFDSGANVRRGVNISDNTFFNQGYGITAQHGLQFSVIHGNYGSDLSGTGALINLDSSGASQFQGTTIDDNSQSGTVTVTFYDQAGGGYYLGRNISGQGFQGTQTATAAGCTISAGAIGNTCASPVTLAFPTQFVDATITNIQCSQAGGSGANGVTEATIVDAQHISVVEIALSASATGGGTLTCSAYHG